MDLHEPRSTQDRWPHILEGDVQRLDAALVTQRRAETAQDKESGRSRVCSSGATQGVRAREPGYATPRRSRAPPPPSGSRCCPEHLGTAGPHVTLSRQERLRNTISSFPESPCTPPLLHASNSGKSPATTTRWRAGPWRSRAFASLPRRGDPNMGLTLGEIFCWRSWPQTARPTDATFSRRADAPVDRAVGPRSNPYALK